MSWSLVSSNVPVDRTEEHALAYPVTLVNVELKDGRELAGHVVIRTLASSGLNRFVSVRYSADNWRTVSPDLACVYNGLVSSEAGYSDDAPADRFSFSFDLSEVFRGQLQSYGASASSSYLTPSNVFKGSLIFAVRLDTEDGTYWDNNETDDYTVVVTRPVITSYAASVQSRDLSSNIAIPTPGPKALDAIHAHGVLVRRWALFYLILAILLAISCTALTYILTISEGHPKTMLVPTVVLSWIFTIFVLVKAVVDLQSETIDPPPPYLAEDSETTPLLGGSATHVHATPTASWYLPIHRFVYDRVLVPPPIPQPGFHAPWVVLLLRRFVQALAILYPVTVLLQMYFINSEYRLVYPPPAAEDPSSIYSVIGVLEEGSTGPSAFIIAVSIIALPASIIGTATFLALPLVVAFGLVCTPFTSDSPSPWYTWVPRALPTFPLSYAVSGLIWHLIIYAIGVKLELTVAYDVLIFALAGLPAVALVIAAGIASLSHYAIRPIPFSVAIGFIIVGLFAAAVTIGWLYADLDAKLGRIPEPETPPEDGGNDVPSVMAKILRL
ncbi:putative phosphatase regulatory subunit-domain-containing protein [Cladochytrium replicatum]|nr:putative phosphatase regulatory subunit-domain-containing protein [Cladochytrium replicatum]